MPQVKVSNLTGTALDYAVAKAEGQKLGNGYNGKVFISPYGNVVCDDHLLTVYSPSTNWNQGGPIIQEQGMIVGLWDTWEAKIHLTDDDYTVIVQTGDTPLIAGMRCLVASKLGDEVEIPEELLK